MQNLFQELIELLSGDDRLVSEGKLMKNKVVELTHNLDPSLLKYLLKSDSLKKHFFCEVEGVLIFDKIRFQKFVSNKKFLPDSFTAFKNKIGLVAGDEYLNNSSEVVLAWPYKDCVLEGGQDKQDAKRTEVFWNELLAPNEIDRLLAPKVLSNFKKFDGDNSLGECYPCDVRQEDNLVIKGNNLLALHTIKEKFSRRVKLIYIDPPYFFDEQKEADSFLYNSNFKLSTWLTFMKDRLAVAKQLLSEGGTIWISINDDGMHYLKVLCDGIYGKEHFVGTIPRRARTAKSDVPFNLSQDFDWILCYTNVSEKHHVVGRSVERKYYESPDFPGRPWRIMDLTSQRTAAERPNSYFTLKNPKDGTEYPSSQKRTWSITEDTFEEYYNNKRIIFPGDYDFLKIKVPYMRQFKDEDDKKGRLSAVMTDFQIKDFIDNLIRKSPNKKGNKEIDDLFGRDGFGYAKPENLIKSIIEVATQEGDLVLDFFAGSGTTAAVAHKMGRQYITIEQMDYVEDLVSERLKQVMAGEQGGISKEVNWTGGGEFVYCELAKANQVFVDSIQSAKSSEELLGIWNTMQDKAFLSYRVNPKAFDQSKNDFIELSFADQKKFLIETLDKNMLYVPLSEIDDATYEISAADKALNKEFFS